MSSGYLEAAPQAYPFTSSSTSGGVFTWHVGVWCGSTCSVMRSEVRMASSVYTGITATTREESSAPPSSRCMDLVIRHSGRATWKRPGEGTSLSASTRRLTSRSVRSTRSATRARSYTERTCGMDSAPSIPSSEEKHESGRSYQDVSGCVNRQEQWFDPERRIRSHGFINMASFKTPESEYRTSRSRQPGTPVQPNTERRRVTGFVVGPI